MYYLGGAARSFTPTLGEVRVFNKNIGSTSWAFNTPFSKTRTLISRSKVLLMRSKVQLMRSKVQLMRSKVLLMRSKVLLIREQYYTSSF